MVRSLLAISLVILNVAGAIAAEPPVRVQPKPVYCQIRILEGKRNGNEALGTLRVLAEPILTTTEWREGAFVTGGEVAVPGTDERLPFGTSLKITPGKFEQGAIFAKLSLDVVQLAKLEEKSIAACSGNVVRAAGTFPCGKPVQIVIKDLGGGNQLWAEITLDAESKLMPVKKAPAGKYQEVPTATAREKASRR